MRIVHYSVSIFMEGIIHRMQATFFTDPIGWYFFDMPK